MRLELYTNAKQSCVIAGYSERISGFNNELQKYYVRGGSLGFEGKSASEE